MFLRRRYQHTDKGRERKTGDKVEAGYNVNNPRSPAGVVVVDIEPAVFKDFQREGPERASLELRHELRTPRNFVRHLLQSICLKGGPKNTDVYLSSDREYTTRAVVRSMR